MRMDLRRLSKNANRQLEQMSPRGHEPPSVKHDLMESVAIVVGVVCLALGSEYILMALLRFVGLAGPAADANANAAWDKALESNAQVG